MGQGTNQASTSGPGSLLSRLSQAVQWDVHHFPVAVLAAAGAGAALLLVCLFAVSRPEASAHMAMYSFRSTLRVRYHMALYSFYHRLCVKHHIHSPVQRQKLPLCHVSHGPVPSKVGSAPLLRAIPALLSQKHPLCQATTRLCTSEAPEAPSVSRATKACTALCHCSLPPLRYNTGQDHRHPLCQALQGTVQRQNYHLSRACYKAMYCFRASLRVIVPCDHSGIALDRHTLRLASYCPVQRQNDPLSRASRPCPASGVGSVPLVWAVCTRK